jgi:hypothetical protein
MSLTDPDARNRKVGNFLEPVAWVLALASLALAPVVDFLVDTSKDPNTSAWFVPGMMGYILITVGFGLMLYYTSAHKNPIGIWSYVLAYVAGLILILGAYPYKGTIIPQGIIPSLVIYGAAAVMVIVYVVHARMGQATLANGVETTATITSAGVNGMVNYVTHWKLTLKFTDQSGKERWFHTGKTGWGYEVGQQYKIKYNGKNPGSRFGIVILGNA